MCPCPDISSKIDSPQHTSIQFIGIEKYRPGISRMGIIPSCTVPLQNQFVLTIAIKICDTCIICRIGIDRSIRSFVIRRFVYRQIEIVMCQILCNVSMFFFFSVRNLLYLIPGMEIAFFIQIIRCIVFSNLCNPFSVRINMKLRRFIFPGGEPEGQIHSPPCAYRHSTSVKLFHLPSAKWRKNL